MNNRRQTVERGVTERDVPKEKTQDIVMAFNLDRSLQRTLLLILNHSWSHTCSVRTCIQSYLSDDVISGFCQSNFWHFHSKAKVWQYTSNIWADQHIPAAQITVNKARLSLIIICQNKLETNSNYYYCYYYKLVSLNCIFKALQHKQFVVKQKSFLPSCSGVHINHHWITGMY